MKKLSKEELASRIMRNEILHFLNTGKGRIHLVNAIRNFEQEAFGQMFFTDKYHAVINYKLLQGEQTQ